jgi:hypothetical protein
MRGEGSQVAGNGGYDTESVRYWKPRQDLVAGQGRRRFATLAGELIVAETGAVSV